MLPLHKIGDRCIVMTVQTKIRAIQTVCWIGAAADALWSLALLSPRIYGILTARPHLQPDLFTRLTMAIGASVMLGWTLLLAWTAANPIERRAVMLITALPVLAGLLTIATIGFLSGNTGNLWILGKCLLLTVAMLAGYHMAAAIAKEGISEIDH